MMKKKSVRKQNEEAMTKKLSLIFDLFSANVCSYLLSIRCSVKLTILFFVTFISHIQQIHNPHTIYTFSLTVLLQFTKSVICGIQCWVLY